MHINDQHLIEYFLSKVLLQNFRTMDDLEDVKVHDLMFQVKEDHRVLVVFELTGKT